MERDRTVEEKIAQESEWERYEEGEMAREGRQRGKWRKMERQREKSKRMRHIQRRQRHKELERQTHTTIAFTVHTCLLFSHYINKQSTVGPTNYS